MLSGLNARLFTLPWCPVSGEPIARPLATSHSRIAPSSPPAATILPSGLKARARTLAVGPDRNRTRCGGTLSRRAAAHCAPQWYWRRAPPPRSAAAPDRHGSLICLVACAARSADSARSRSLRVPRARAAARALATASCWLRCGTRLSLARLQGAVDCEGRSMPPPPPGRAPG